MLMNVAGFILFLVCSFISLALKITNKDLNCSSDQKKGWPILILNLNFKKKTLSSATKFFRVFYKLYFRQKLYIFSIKYLILFFSPS